jgi:hypothetical protein
MFDFSVFIPQLIVGIFLICGAIFDFDFLFDHPHIGSLIKKMGRRNCRILFFLAGVFVIFVGARYTYWIMQMKK